MIEFTQGNLLDARAEALVNTVNTQGVMGKGIALQFKQAFPSMYREYERACAAGEVKLGRMHVVDLGGLVGGPRWIINFPTKGHWRGASKIADVEAGLTDLVRVIRETGIRSIAVPPLGCGLGGLAWGDVRPRIEAALMQVPEVKTFIFAPGGPPAADVMPNRTQRPKMTVGQAALIALMDRYLKGLLDPFVSLLEIHKLLYFLQAAGQPLRLKYEARLYGPYATNLRQVLIRMEKHYTQGYGDGKDNPSKPIELMPGAVAEATAFLASDHETMQRMNCVDTLIEGYEDAYGMELLSSVHWVITHDPAARTSVDIAVDAVQTWNNRKNRTLKAEHLKKAWQRLTDFGWDSAVKV